MMCFGTLQGVSISIADSITVAVMFCHVLSGFFGLLEYDHRQK